MTSFPEFLQCWHETNSVPMLLPLPTTHHQPLTGHPIFTECNFVFSCQKSDLKRRCPCLLRLDGRGTKQNPILVMAPELWDSLHKEIYLAPVSLYFTCGWRCCCFFCWHPLIFVWVYARMPSSHSWLQVTPNGAWTSREMAYKCLPLDPSPGIP